MDSEIIVYSTLIVAVATVGAMFLHWYYYRQQNIISKNEIHYYAMLEIMKIFNDTETALNRNIIYSAYRKNQLYDKNDDILEKYSDGIQHYDLPPIVASVRGSFDQMGKLVKEGYVRKEEFLDMYVGSVIQMGKVLERHILHEREKRRSDHFATHFEEIFNDAREFWSRKFSNFPEPEPF